MIILGSTGSVGRQALEVAQFFNLPIEALSAGRNVELLNAQIATHKPKKIAILDEKDYPHLKAPTGTEVFIGAEGIAQMVVSSKSELVLNALVGFGGLEPSLCAVRAGKTLALANKESLVVGGWLLKDAQILPIDSEHFALHSLLKNTPKECIDALFLTASGGALRDTPLEQIAHQSLSEVLKHPNWQMGIDITINSASMINKLFEVLEAYWLFGGLKVEACIERSSCVHALVRFKDQSWHAQLSQPDMRLPIIHALSPKNALNAPMKPLDLFNTSLNFEPIDLIRYPLWGFKNLLLQQPKLGVVLNASNEEALKAFKTGGISFGKMRTLVAQSLEHFKDNLPPLESLEQIKSLDLQVRNFVRNLS
ncbi:1-deoxy-D-xylulose 5-phosphate reductoisomerase Dxr [Helicobacter sp. NHP19-012]|uniref:1-deoxy-D-xylulose 5-phosphate reductoisomerase n=1 Tax=Helicobacter gastrofelis TaxID=2849642 RepID=A0ABN6I4Q2_9HELI|nr:MULTISPECIES: 1-deoxy-D-xylulose-5-phosphate reductoisomerase [unclassified Helicobacter]BCZ18545.1 1-deoxy-D-xylulose 5-phosphate reductoisomerase Dxr [Helicobacter sp. NHP19-012]GMB95818.1 1-deoxy-D-xylulose 5-phosphate reductoisomerase Dxr [Helicobacter sp. NHP22-001]